MFAVAFGGVKGEFSWRTGENQPTLACVDGMKTEDIAKKPAIGLGIFRVYDGMQPEDHGYPPVSRVDTGPGLPLWSRPSCEERIMKVINSLKTAKKRHKNCRVVRRRGRVYVINKTNPRFKARQG